MRVAEFVANGGDDIQTPAVCHHALAIDHNLEDPVTGCRRHVHQQARVHAVAAHPVLHVHDAVVGDDRANEPAERGRFPRAVVEHLANRRVRRADARDVAGTGAGGPAGQHQQQRSPTHAAKGRRTRSRSYRPFSAAPSGGGLCSVRRETGESVHRDMNDTAC